MLVGHTTRYLVSHCHWPSSPGKAKGSVFWHFRADIITTHCLLLDTPPWYANNVHISLDRFESTTQIRHIKYKLLNMLKINMTSISQIKKKWLSFRQIWIFITHMKHKSPARHNFKWAKNHLAIKWFKTIVNSTNYWKYIFTISQTTVFSFCGNLYIHVFIYANIFNYTNTKEY